MATDTTTEMLQVTPSELKSIIRLSLEQERALMIWGEPGISKSECVNQVAKEIDAKLVCIHLSQFDSVDLRGIPGLEVLESGGRMTGWYPPKFIPFLGNPAFSLKKPIIIFLDELPQAMHAVQAPAMQLVLERRIGEHELMPNVRVLAAGNLESHKSGSNSMLAALRNRFRHVQLQASHESWCEWAIGANIDPRLIAYIRFKPENLSTFQNKDGVVTNHKAYATPRTWEWVSKTINIPGISRDMRLKLITGDVGPGPAAELDSFLSLVDKMPDIDYIYKNPTTADVPENDVAMLYAVSSAVSAHCKTGKLLEQITPYITRLPVEYSVRTIQDIMTRIPDLANTKEFNQFAEKHQNLFTI